MKRRISMSSSRQDGVALLMVTGEIGPEEAAELGDAIAAAVSEPATRCVVVDLSSVDVIDYHAVECLVAGYRTAELLGCRLQITSPSPAVLNSVMEQLRRTATVRDRLAAAAVRIFELAEHTGTKPGRGSTSAPGDG